jgi:GT2 family glycosyltransferase
MTLGLLIATRNRAAQLAYGLQSIYERNYEIDKMLIIDDGSKDNTRDIVKRFGPEFEYCRIERDGGFRHNPAVVLNIGHKSIDMDITIEQGGEVCHLTDCVTPLVEACRPGIMALATVFNGTPEEMRLLKADIDEGNYQFAPDIIVSHPRTNGDTWAVPKLTRHNIQLYCGFERQAPFMFCGAIHKEDFEKVGGYDETLKSNNDGDLADRLITKGVKFCFVGRAVAFHLQHGKS